MSYSYITKVFPKFQYSNIYDANLYNNISGLNKQTDIIASNENTLEDQTINKKYVEVIKPAPLDLNLETYKNISNQTYYNKPLPSNLLNNDNSNILNNDITNIITKTDYNLQNSIPVSQKELDLHKEFFSETTQNHDNYTTHILECDQCKSLLLKQFNIETERIRNEEILELIAFLIFGLFILLLLDGFKK